MEIEMTSQGDRLERDAAGSGAVAAAIPTPPAKSKIRFYVEDGAVHFVIRRWGKISFCVSVLLLMAWCLSFVSVLEVYDITIPPENSASYLLLLSPLGFPVVLLLCWLLAVWSSGPTDLVVGDRRLRAYVTFLGRQWRCQSVPTDEIGQVDLEGWRVAIRRVERLQIGDQRVVVRTDKAWTQFRAPLSYVDRRWLVGALKMVIAKA